MVFSPIVWSVVWWFSCYPALPGCDNPCTSHSEVLIVLEPSALVRDRSQCPSRNHSPRYRQQTSLPRLRQWMRNQRYLFSCPSAFRPLFTRVLYFVLLARYDHMRRSRLNPVDVLVGTRLSVRLRTLEMVDWHELPRIEQTRLVDNLAPAFLMQNV